MLTLSKELYILTGMATFLSYACNAKKILRVVLSYLK